MFQGGGRHGDAEAAFRAALDLDPKLPTGHMGLAYLAEQRQDWQTSAREYRAALESAPGNDFARRRLAGVLLTAGSRAEAFTEFWNLASRNPRDTTYLKELGSFLMVDRDWTAARAAYQQAVERDPKDADALAGLGQAFEKDGRPEEARRQYEAAVAAAPKRPSAYFLLGALHEAQKRPGEAIKAYERLVEVAPGDSAGRWQLAQLYRDTGQDEKALEQMRRIVLRGEDPNRLAYRLGPANLFLARRRYADAVAEIEKVIAEEPQAPILRYALADAYLKAGRAEEAEKAAQELVAKARPEEVARSRSLLARVFEETGRLDLAAQGYEEALAADAADADARAGLVRVREKQGKRGAAGEYLEALATANPAAPTKDALAALEALYTRGAKAEPAKWVAFARRVAEKYPDSREALSAAAGALLRWSNPDRPATKADQEAALALYRRVLELDPADAEAKAAVKRLDGATGAGEGSKPAVGEKSSGTR
jgi:tetratricopeptide (TPR) repeat protein